MKTLTFDELGAALDIADELGVPVNVVLDALPDDRNRQKSNPTDKILAAREKIMEAVCGLCHWPYAYRDEEIMYAEKCDICPAAAAVEAALKEVKT